MARRKTPTVNLTPKTTTENEYGIDRWTSNGYGIKLDPLTPEQKKTAARINAELAAAGLLSEQSPEEDENLPLNLQLLDEQP